MYGHHGNNDLSYALSAEFLCHFPLPELTAPSSSTPAPFPPHHLMIPGVEFDSAPGMYCDSSVNHSASSGCSSYGSPSSLGSCATIQRSVSSHSLQKNVNGGGGGFHHQLVSSPTEFFDSETSPVRRVFSTGDMQERNHGSESQLANELSIIESMSKACRYSPEEKKERIERYRTKRTQRNFTKKIKYECRKTLADSRPRIRGRFARNDELEKIPQNQWNDGGVEEDDDNWTKFLDAFSANLIP